MKTCEFFEPRDMFNGNRCRYWKNAGTDHRGDPYPAHCSHKQVMHCETDGYKYLPRDDQEDDSDDYGN